MQFERPHHQRIAHVLQALNGDTLRQHGCLFGGGTCIALRHGEYRESVDIDFLVSDAAGYRELRQLLTGPHGLAAITHAHAQPLEALREIRADQYGIRTQVQMDGQAIKLEIVREARQFEAKGFRILAAQSVIDMFLDEESQSLAMLIDFIGKPISLAVESQYTQEQFDVVLL